MEGCTRDERPWYVPPPHLRTKPIDRAAVRRAVALRLGFAHIVQPNMIKRSRPHRTSPQELVFNRRI
jgi:hypothetical protein